MERLIYDLRFAARVLRRRPGFTIVAVITLALGIGANTAIFSVVNAVLLRPLPYTEPDRLVMAYDSFPDFPRDGLSEFEYMTLRNGSKSFKDISISNGASLTLTGSGEPERVQAAVVSSNYFDMLGVSVAVGRGFAPDEDLTGKNNTVILSNAFWKRRFSGEAQAVGQPIRLNDRDYTIAGVLPSDFRSPIELQFGTSAGVWLGYGFDPGNLNRGSHGLITIARLQDGVAIDRAQQELKTIIGSVVADNSSYYPKDGSFSSYLVPLHDALVGDVRPALMVLLCAVATVLLIACANVANLLLARGEARQKEIAVRTAIGARRWHIMRQLLAESLVLAVAGGALGLLLARWGLDALTAISPGNIPRIDEIGLDSRVGLFTLAVSLMTGVIFGLAPAFQASKTDLNSALKEGGRASGDASRGRLRQTLVVVEVAMALVLLTGAGLLLRSFWRLQRVATGFGAEHVLTMRLSPLASSYQNNDQVSAMYERLMQDVKSLPGVQSAAVTDRIPMGGGNGDTIMQIDGRPFELETARYNTDFRVVSPEYFEAMRIRLIAGRYFSESDKPGAGKVAIINETLARRQWPDQDPIGKRLRLLDAPPERATSEYMEIVGTVADAKNRSLTGETRQDVYVPLRQQAVSMGGLGPSVSMGLVVRTAVEPASLTNAIREKISSIDRNIPITQVRTMEQVLANAVVQPRFNTIVLGAFAAAALCLGAIGIYGVVSYSMARRTREIGLRMALGAQTRDVLSLVLREGMSVVLVGVAIGLAGALALSRVMTGLLFGVTATDPWTFVAIPLTLIAVALAACWIPARRAVRVDPMVALRYE
jgi:putative ABC transport system permease protein